MAWLNKLKLADGTPRMSIARVTFDSISEKRRERISQEKSSKDDETAPEDFLEQDSSKFTERDIYVGLSSSVVAGPDTTAAVLTGILHCSLKGLACLAKVRNEISSRVSVGKLSSPPTFKEAQNMPYLQAVLQEAMCLYPQGGLPFQRVVPEGGAEICGHYFPAKAVVGVSSWVMHLDTSIFGADTAGFRPGALT